MIMRVKVQTLNDDVYYVSQILIREFFVSLRNGLPSGVFFAPHYYVQMIPQIARPDIAHCVINLKCFIIRIRRLPNLIFSCCCSSCSSSSALNAYTNYCPLVVICILQERLVLRLVHQLLHFLGAGQSDSEQPAWNERENMK